MMRGLRDWIGGALFGLAYTILGSIHYAGRPWGPGFHFLLATLAGWAFFRTSGLLERGRTLEPVPLSHPLIRWPAFIIAVCVVFALTMRNVRPVLLPLSSALAVLSGSIGGLLSVWLRRSSRT